MCIDKDAQGIGSSSIESYSSIISPVSAAGTGTPLSYAAGYQLTCVQCGGSSATSGAVYTRWGRTTCPSDATALYSGQVAGAGAGSTGGGLDYLCLAPTPAYLQVSSGSYAANSYIYATSYQTSAAGISSTWNARINYKVPCTVCQVGGGRSYSFVQPGRAICPSGFSLDFAGYLMASYSSSQYRTSYTCVDQAAETMADNTQNGGSFLYFTQTPSGTYLPPGYTSYYELACSHCTVTSASSGSTFINWGSSTCPSSSTTIYSGSGAGSLSTLPGSGHEYLCLPPVPSYLSYNPSQYAGSYAYIAEYYTSSSGVKNFIALSGGSVPCSLCQRPLARSNAIMVPAMNTCPGGYTADYTGFLMSPSYGAGKGEWVCVNAGAALVSNVNYAGAAYMYTVEGQTPIPPGYSVGYELTCTMCSVGAVPVPPPPPPPPVAASGTVYTRWGRTSCPSSAALVYQGIAAGSVQTGSGANMQCLPADPTFAPGQYSEADDSAGGISKAEYNTINGGIATFKILNGQDVPCAVCKRLVPDSKSLMVPGTYTCPSGFSPDYIGYIFAPLSYRGSYLCIDSAAEGVGSSATEGGHQISPVETATGSGAPAFYSAGYELTCVQCGSTATGSVFTRWGSSTCPTGTNLVYAGLGAGPTDANRYYYYWWSYYYWFYYYYWYWNYQYYASVNNGGAGFLCLSNSPSYLQVTSGAQGASQLYRAQYQTNQANLAGWSAKQSYGIPCAVCQNQPAKQYSFLQPGSKTCPTGFNTDYAGYMMTSGTGFHRTEFLCVDQGGETSGTNVVQLSALLFLTQTPSTNGPLGFTSMNEVTCSHCTATNSGGSVFVEWGSSTCPSTSTQVYSGQAAGSYYSQGGAHNNLCLPMSAQYLSYDPAVTAGAMLYTSQYYTMYGGVPAYKAVAYGHAACSVCQRPATRPYGIMIPGSTQCPYGYALDYAGNLMSAAGSASFRGEYVCASSSPDIVNGKVTSPIGYLWYEAEVTAPMPPNYFVGYELACAVCSGYTLGNAPPPPPPPPPPTVTAGGDIFVRWGRTVCPSSSTLVYTGTAANGGQSNPGSGSNMQCLPYNPQYTPGQYSDTASSQEGFIYRAEYNTNTAGLPYFVGLHGMEIPCSVCRRTNVGSRSLMVPGATDCPSSFAPDYQGYLFAPATSSYRGEYVCMDSSAEGIGSTGVEGGATLSPVEVATSTAPLGYAAGYEMACVVCGSTTSGSVYTRWGRTVCPSSATAVYRGYTAGNQYATQGGGTQYLCLTNAPQYLTTTSGVQSPSSALYRTTYMTSASGLGGNFATVNNYQAPCVVCQAAAGRSYSYMQPGSAVCPSGFTADYQGYIVSAQASYRRTRYECLDAAPEYTGDNLGGGAQLYLQQTVASTNSPLGYSNMYVVACAHCTVNDATGGEVFTAWGAQTCPSGSSQVYAGQATGTYYNYGSGSNYLCLTMTPSYLSYAPSYDAGGRLFAAYYQTALGGSPALTPLTSTQVPCTMCQRSVARSSSVTIPAATTCPFGFSLDYVGFLMSSRNDLGRSEYVCLTQAATQLGTKVNVYGGWLCEVSGVTPLPPGYVNQWELSCAVCSACSGNAFISTDGACVAATTCSAGTYASQQPTSDSDRVCSQCSPGSYQSQNGYILSTCTACANSYQNENGGASCKACSPGYLVTGAGATSQSQCAAGSYCTGCVSTLCSAGTYQSAAASSACISCPSNRYQNEQGQVMCKVCAAGTYAISSGTAVTSCVAGNQCINCASQACAAGTFQSSGGQSACSTCPTGQYQDGSGATACKACSTGYYTTTQTSQTQCSAGYQCQSCAMQACPSGMYQNLAGQTACKSYQNCAAGTYMSSSGTSIADRVCTACPTGTFQTAANTLPSCSAAAVCGVGTYQVTAYTATSDTVCTACPANTYQDLTGQTACKPLVGCSPGSYTSSLPANGNRVCSLCSLGATYQNEAGFTGTSCKPVSTPCLPGTYTSTAATLSNDRVCTTCSTGQYQDVSGQTACKITSSCVAGTYISAAATLSSNVVCGACNGVTTFQNLAGQTACKNVATCTSSQYTVNLPTTVSDRTCAPCTVSCSAGFFLTGTCSGQQNAYCSPCTPPCATCSGSATTCTSCQGSLVLSNGACSTSCSSQTQYSVGTSCVNCVSPCGKCFNATSCITCTTNNLYNGGCVATCPTNYYVSTATGDSRCAPCSSCSAGNYASQACSSTQDTVCQSWSVCSAGQMQYTAPTATSNRACVGCTVPLQYQNEAGQVFCKPTFTCQPGTKQSVAPTAISDRTCDSCPVGTSQGATGQTTCQPCAAGSYQNLTGQASCVSCPLSAYQPSQGQSTCLSVPAGSYRTADGTGALPCQPGSFCTGGSATPVACDGLTQYQDQASATNCKTVSLCAAGTYQAVAPSPSRNRGCTACPYGTYMSQSGNVATSCIADVVCQPGTVFSFNGSTTADAACTSCVSGSTYQNEAGAYACKAVTNCGPGTQQVVAPTTLANRICQSCVIGLSYQTATNALSCSSVTQCSPGTYQTAAATLSSNTVCAACGAGTFQNEAGQLSCKTATVCQPGQYMSAQLSTSVDRTCAACAAGTFQAAAGTATSCATAATCAAGTYIATAATTTSNTVCRSCQINATFSTQAGATACTSVQLCSAGQFVYTQPSLIADRSCAACPNGQYQPAPYYVGTTCTPWSATCPLGSVESVTPTATNDRTCAQCDGVNYYADVTGLTVCKSGTVCLYTQYISRQMTPFSDRVCSNCTQASECRQDAFLQGNCSLTSNPVCVACYQTCATCNSTGANSCQSCINGLALESDGSCTSTCVSGEYMSSGLCHTCTAPCAACSAAGSSSCIMCKGSLYLSSGQCLATCPAQTFASTVAPDDNRCVACTTCPYGFYASANCTSVQDTNCSAWKVCPAGTYESLAPTPYADRVCAPCNGVTQYQDQAGQRSCLPVSACSYPNVEGLPPTPTSNRLCICDRPSCTAMTTSQFTAAMCMPPSTSDVATGVDSCCSGATAAVYLAVLQATADYANRHSCSGCTATCSCTAGYYQAASNGGTVCQACDGVTGYSSAAGATSCSPITACAAGTIQSAAPTTTSNRVCQQCAAGTSDIAATGQACTACPSGSYVPAGSYGACGQFACPAGSANIGGDPSVPCTTCPTGTFQPLPGQTICNITTVCAAGFEELTQPSTTQNRYCRSCILGYTFKALAGQTTSCVAVSHCGAGMEEVSPPTLSTDRVCQACVPGATYKATMGDFACSAVTNCTAGQEEVLIPTLVSDRTCRACVVGLSYKAQAGQATQCLPDTVCTTDTQYTSVPATATSDRVCASLSVCDASSTFISTYSTSTSNRVCTNCTICPSNKFQIQQCSGSQNAQCAGCSGCTYGTTLRAQCTATADTLCFPCTNCTAGYYQTVACSMYQDTVCKPVTQCATNQFTVVAATAFTDAVCGNVTQCTSTQYIKVPATSVSNAICQDLTVCLPGSMVTVPPSLYSNRQCDICPAGTTDLQSTGVRCTPCPAGTYSPPGSMGPCSQFQCPPGSYDSDDDATTPCMSCNYTYTYQGLYGQDKCFGVTTCGLGYQEVAPPTLFTNRYCQSCFPGYTYRSALDATCQPVTVCTSSQYITAFPTISSDRTCAAYTVCPTWTTFQMVPPTPTSDRACQNVSTCLSTQYASAVQTATTDRVCSNITTCTSAQYEAISYTATTDRTCMAVTSCIVGTYEVMAPTATTDRACNRSWGVSSFFAADYSTVAGSPVLLAQWSTATNDTMVNMGMPSLSLVGMTVQPGSIVMTMYVSQAAWQQQLQSIVASGNFSVLNYTAFLCPATHFFVPPINPTTGAVRCDAILACTAYQYQYAPPTATSNRDCRTLTLCASGVAVPATATSDTVCANPLSDGSTSSGSSAGLAPAVVAIVVILIVIVIALMGGMFYIHKKRQQDRRKKEEARDAQRAAEMNATMRDGNALLNQLNSSMQFGNPLFMRTGGEGYLDVRPQAGPEWMVGMLTREQAEAALGPRGVGGFLVRASNVSGCFVLSIKAAEGKFEHHRLLLVNGAFTINGKNFSQPCATLYDVLDHLAVVKDHTDTLLDHEVGNLYGVGSRDEEHLYGKQAEAQPSYGIRQPWLVTMTRSEAEKALASNPTRGHFLVRESESRPGQYAISVVLKARDIEHHSLKNAPNGSFLLNDKPLRRECFELNEVVEHLTQYKESMSTTLSMAAYEQAADEDMYTGLRVTDTVKRGTSMRTADSSLSNPTYFEGPETSLYAEETTPGYHDTPGYPQGVGASAPGYDVLPSAYTTDYNDPAPQYVGPGVNDLGYLMVEGAPGFVPQSATVPAARPETYENVVLPGEAPARGPRGPSYENVTADSFRRRRETPA